MEIKTKYDIGNEVWFMNSNKPVCQPILAVHIDVNRIGIIIAYGLRYGVYTEEKVFATKEALIESLLK